MQQAYGNLSEIGKSNEKADATDFGTVMVITRDNSGLRFRQKLKSKEE